MRGVICWRWETVGATVIGLITVVAVAVLCGTLVDDDDDDDDDADVGAGGGAFRALNTACCSGTPRKP